MTSKRKKLSLSFQSKMKGNGLIFYQNLWYSPKLTKKGQKWAKMKGKVYSTEQGRPILKQNLQKRFSFASASEKQTEANSVSVIGQKRLISPVLFHAGAISSKVIQPIEKIAIQTSSSENIGDIVSKALFEKKYRKTGMERKKVQNLITKRFWFFDNAAPIPGVSSLKKRKILFRAKQRSFQTIQSWLQILTKKQMKKFFGTFPIQKMKNFSQKWTPFMLMDSMYQNVQNKTAFTQNAHERNALLFSQKRTVNGNFVKKIRTFSGIGDLFLLTDTAPATSFFSKSSPSKKGNSLGLHKLESFYAKKSPIFQNLSFLLSSAIDLDFEPFHSRTEQNRGNTESCCFILNRLKKSSLFSFSLF